MGDDFMNMLSDTDDPDEESNAGEKGMGDLLGSLLGGGGAGGSGDLGSLLGGLMGGGAAGSSAGGATGVKISDVEGNGIYASNGDINAADVDLFDGGCQRHMRLVHRALRIERPDSSVLHLTSNRAISTGAAVSWKQCQAHGDAKRVQPQIA